MEGLAITPDGKKLIGVMQASLIQDSRRLEEDKFEGRNYRILEIDIESGKTREFVYSVEKPKSKISEILAIDDHKFLVSTETTNLATTHASSRSSPSI